ncbi:hypothetical protein [Nostoc sp. FACHB-133]|uniref:hypothetical protein n=1 Tax=Nostoc sp. FACHB-133 TaxID=2692835 RepID=UPI0016824441|nr:hypothetical protein [Nostoc sp. FACHB-133]MBD2526649.1 hypothetical protein [Nostoc sp. FACHB-133]
MEFWTDLAHELTRLKSSKLPYFQLSICNRRISPDWRLRQIKVLGWLGYLLDKSDRLRRPLPDTKLCPPRQLFLQN